MKIILDTNFLLIPERFKVNIFEELDIVVEEKYELIVPEGVVNELKRLAERKGKDGRAARVALVLMEKKKIKILKTKEDSVDKAIKELAKRFKNCAVATLDSKLKKDLLMEGKKVIYLRAKKYLVLE